MTELENVRRMFAEELQITGSLQAKKLYIKMVELERQESIVQTTRLRKINDLRKDYLSRS